MWFVVILVLQNLPKPHFHSIKLFFFILGNFDPENPRNICIIKFVWPKYVHMVRIEFEYKSDREAWIKINGLCL